MGALEAAWRAVAAGTGPLFPGAVLLHGHEDTVLLHRSTGYASRYADGARTLLPADQQQPARPDTIFDLASLTKLFTAIAIMQQVEAGQVDLDAPVSDFLPEFAAPTVTVRQLLTHTSGLPFWLPLWSSQPDQHSRLHAALTAEPATAPATAFCYSDLNLIALGELASHVAGAPLDQLITEGITGPLGMIDTGFRPTPALRDRIAATEFQQAPDRGLVWGEVHDENAWALGGVAGHAGMFGTAGDLALLVQSFLGRGQEILRRETVQQMITNETAGFPGHDHGLGFELNQPWYMGRLSAPTTAGHTGFTGTSLVIDFAGGGYVVLLTNRVHPRRDGGSVNPARIAAADGLAAALATERRSC
jgi:CubicO group peptidase (beta-lactamase class C family)